MQQVIVVLVIIGGALVPCHSWAWLASTRPRAPVLITRRRIIATRKSSLHAATASTASTSTTSTPAASAECDTQQQLQQQQQQPTISSSSGSSNSSSSQSITVNPLLNVIQPSKTVEIFSKVKQMQAEGQLVTSLCVGEPDYAPPRSVLEAVAQAALAGDDTKYTAVTGTLELRRAICDDLLRRKGVQYQPSQVVVGNGAKQSVFQAIWATCGQPNDVVIVPAPYWPSYPEMVKLVGATPVVLPTKAEEGYLITPSALRDMLEQHRDTAKLLILCNPSNPTGAVHDATRLQELALVLQDYPQVAVLADEIYERLVYTNNNNNNTSSSHTCFASLPHMWHRTLTINGFSKSHAMTGLRLGYVAGPSHLVQAITTLQSQLTSCAGSLSQVAGVAALNVPDEEMQEHVVVMQAKRDWILQQLAEHVPHLRIAVPPQGAFYVLPDVSYYCKEEDAQFCIDLLETQALALVPGSSFGAPGTVRISYATSWEELQHAMDKLRQFVHDHEQNKKSKTTPENGAE